MNKLTNEAQNAIQQLEWALINFKSELSDRGKSKLWQITWKLNNLRSNYEEYLWRDVKHAIEDLRDEASDRGRQKITGDIRWKVQIAERCIM